MTAEEGARLSESRIDESLSEVDHDLVVGVHDRVPRHRRSAQETQNDFGGLFPNSPETDNDAADRAFAMIVSKRAYTGAFALLAISSQTSAGMYGLPERSLR